MNDFFYELVDNVRQWWRYPQPNWLQRTLQGKYTDSFDLEHVMRKLASEDSARYVIKNMRTVSNFKTDYQLREHLTKHCLDENLDLVLEFGVASGRSINQIARRLPNNIVHGFDSFEGLNENWYGTFRKGTFAQPIPKVRRNVKLHVGWFDQTLPIWKESYTSDTIKFLHIDGDLYQSAYTVLDFLSYAIVPGTVILFDEYLNFPGWEQDEHRAWKDISVKYGFEYEYIGYVSKHQQVAIRVTGSKI